ncbi:MAG: glycosyltransferase [Micrococcales bacterium]|nr:glycosyltransferase [Micrococcales bacterium]
MPVRDEAGSVAGAVASVLQQTHQDLEVLVMDGRSSDDTRAIVEAIADPRVRLLDNPGISIPCGLNVGLQAARGEYVARVDAHARVNPEYIALALGHLVADADLAAVGGRRLTEASTPVGRTIGLALSSPFGVGDSINHYAMQAQRTDHASFGVYRTDVARAVGGWDENLPANEDVDFDFRILDQGFEILYEPAMEIHWQVRETLPDLAHQYRRYGRGKGAMVRKNGPSAVRLRHLAPPALVADLGLAGVAALIGRPRVALSLTAPYAAVLAYATVRTRATAHRADASVAAFPAALATMHLSWGLGFLEGLAGREAALGSQRQ